MDLGRRSGVGFGVVILLLREWDGSERRGEDGESGLDDRRVRGGGRSGAGAREGSGGG